MVEAGILLNMKTHTKNLLTAAYDEGIGSLYERVILQTLLPKILAGTDTKTILEYPATITKGYDTVSLLKDYSVTIADEADSSLKKSWPFSEKPSFQKIDAHKKQSKKYDLVWNFALFHQHPEIFPILEKLSSQYILIFTPNVFNWGAPIHWGLHLATLTGCQHPEKGPLELMHKAGLQKWIENHGYTVVKTGYFDMPPWPDFAFSKVELGRSFPFSLVWGKQKADVPQQPAHKDISNLAAAIDASARWERSGVPSWIQPILAHHQYVLAEKK